jgi:hypothetical protein
MLGRFGSKDITDILMFSNNDASNHSYYVVPMSLFMFHSVLFSLFVREGSSLPVSPDAVCRSWHDGLVPD